MATQAQQINIDEDTGAPWIILSQDGSYPCPDYWQHIAAVLAHEKGAGEKLNEHVAACSTCREWEGRQRG